MSLHRYITNAPKGSIADHINNGVNNLNINTSINLRINDHSGNAHNKNKAAGTTSSYMGVSYNKLQEMYGVYVRKNNISYYLGQYKLEIKAAIAYNIKAKDLYGDYANLNNISTDDLNKYQQEVIDNLIRLKRIDP